MIWLIGTFTGLRGDVRPAHRVAVPQLLYGAESHRNSESKECWGPADQPLLSHAFRICAGDGRIERCGGVGDGEFATAGQESGHT